MGLLVAQALAAKHLTAMYVANRTYGRAVKLAEKIGGKAVRLNDLYHYITLHPPAGPLSPAGQAHRRRAPRCPTPGRAQP